MTNPFSISKEFWANKSVCVTGGAGFLGQFVVDKLHERGVKTVFVPRSADYNLVDKAAVEQLMADSKPDILLHLAAKVGGIGANRDHPAEFLYENLMMGAHLLHEAWRQQVSKTVVVGTVCAYPKFTPVPFKEENLWNGYPEETNAPYGIAKKTILAQSQAYRQQYGYNSLFLLPVNLYGPRDNFDLQTSHVIPALIRKCLEAKKNNVSEIVAWGTGSATREFLYVEDAAEAILLATEFFDSSEPINLGSGFEISIRDLMELIAELTGYTGKISWDTTKPDGQPRRSLDTSKAKKEFGFQAKTDFRQGLLATIDWYLKSDQFSATA